MKLVFVYWAYADQGSGCDLRAYARAAHALGHEVILYGPPNPRVALDYSRDLKGVDALIFVFEWTTELFRGDRLDWGRLLAAVPRRRRVVIDCDGMYNDPLRAGMDYNHGDIEASQRWTAVCNALADKVCQPTLHPLRPNVQPFFFHVYDPSWETPLEFSNKEFSMLYVGHSKFRWRPMRRVLEALAPVRDCLGRIGLVGYGWAEPPVWAVPMQIEDHYQSDPLYLERLGVEVLLPVPFREVIPTMSRAVFNPVVYRPMFERLRLVTCRTFETPAAGTIPLFALDEGYVREVYGTRAAELVLPAERPHEKVLDILARPGHYAEIVTEIRQKFAQEHSPEARLRELVVIVES